MPPTICREPRWEHLEHRLPEAYLVLASVLTLLLCWMTPPFFGPDEPNHAYRSISLAHGQLIAGVVREDSGDLDVGGDIDEGVVSVVNRMVDIRKQWEKHSELILDRSYGAITDEELSGQAGERWSGQTTFELFENTAVYPAPLYLPAMTGWRTGEAAGWTVFASLRLARMLCALCAAGLGWLALRFCVGVRWLLLAGLLLPSVLYVNAICSQDALMPCMAAMAVAMLSRPLAGKRNFMRAELTVAAAALGMIAIARPPYAAMALMLFLPAAELRGSWRRWIEPGIAFGAVGIVTAFWWRLVAKVNIISSALGDPDLQRIFLREHPLAATYAVLRGTGYAGFDFFHHGLYVIGVNDLLPHRGAAALLTICLVAISMFSSGPVAGSWRGRALLALSVAGPLLGVSLVEYIIWAAPGAITVSGIQPRYWLPVLPLGMLLLHSCMPWRACWAVSMRKSVVGFAGIAMAMIACTLPWMLAHAYYREGLWHVLRLNLR